MSYSFDGSNDTMTGTFASTYSDPITFGCYIKIADHPLAVDSLICLGNSSSSNNDSYRLNIDSTDNRFQIVSVDSAGATSTASVVLVVDSGTILTTYNATTGWVGLVGVIQATDTGRSLYVGAIENVDTGTADRLVANALQHIRLGESLVAGLDYNGLLAEVAIWNAELSDPEITSYLGGTAASQIAAANLIGYWPLSASNATQANEGIDTGGDLSVTSATFSSDHPTITIPGASTRKRRTGLMGVG